MRKGATPKQTGGGGTSYEDKLAAFFLACLLSNHPPFNYELGTITRIDFQVGADGWQFDDMLLTLDAEGQTKRVAVSAKSNRQFTNNGCPTEVNFDLWEQYLQVHSDVFKRETDMLCLVEAPVSPKLSANVNALLREAPHQNSHIFHERIYSKHHSSKEKRIIYESFRCPPDLATTYDFQENDTGKILKHFLFLEKDYENQISNDEAIAVNICRGALQNKDIAIAKSLFDDLCLVPRTLSPVSGRIDRISLVRNLRNKYALKESPVYEADWKKLALATAEKMANIRSQLGESFRIDNKDSAGQVDLLLQENKGVIIQGISGRGKTNLMKDFAESNRTGRNIWLESSDLEYTTIEVCLHLQYPLTEIIEQASSGSCYLLFDGIERLLPEKQYQQIFTVLRKALDPNSPWKVVLTCPIDALERVHKLFVQYNIDYTQLIPFDLPVLSQQQLLAIVDVYPSLYNLLFSSAYQNIWNNLKLLDKIILNAPKVTSSMDGWGETHFIDFVWKEEVENLENGLQGDYCLKLLSEWQANNLVIGISTTKIPAGVLPIADTLKKTGFLKLQNDKVYFVHDLFSDWARYKLLKSHEADLPEFLSDKHLTSPLWAKAINLLGISLIEQDQTGERWNKYYQLFNMDSAQHLAVRDLLLEAFFLAPDTFKALSGHKQFLFGNAGVLFKRFMKLFFLKATQANPLIIQKAKEINISAQEAAIYSRIPLFNYWIDVLQFLHYESDAVLELDFDNVVKAATMWLETVPEHFLLTQEAGDLILIAVNKISNKYTGNYWGSTLYKGLLLSYLYNPDEVRIISLQLSNRLPKPDLTKEGKVQGPSTLRTSPHFSITKPEPWDLGPLESIDSDFRKVCLNSNALYSILKHAPQLGSEILLALLIEAPEAQHYSSGEFNEHYNLVQLSEWYPPSFMHGPFLFFFKNSNHEALLFTCKLVDFATERWAASSRGDKPSPLVVNTLSGKKEYWGNYQVYNWRRSPGLATNPLISLLMSLEQFFYEQLDTGHDVDTSVSVLVENTKSLAIISVLLTIGKLKMDLFLNQLKPFLAESLLYEWDTGYHRNTLTEADAKSIIEKERIIEWNNRLSQNTPLHQAIIPLLLHSGEFQASLSTYRRKWQEELNCYSSPKYAPFLLQLIHGSDPANYREVKNENGTYLEYREPGEVIEALSQSRKSNIDFLKDSQLAYSILKMLNSDIPFEVHDITYLWEKLQAIVAEINIEAGEHCSGEDAWNSPLNKVFAIFKAMIYHKDVWYSYYPGHLEWIYNYIETIIKRQFEWSGHFNHHGTNLDWNILLGEIIPRLWKEQPERKTFRQVIAGVLLLFNNDTVKSFLQPASSLYTWDDQPFVQVQNLLLLYSVKYYHSDLPGQRDLDTLKTVRNELLQQYIEGKVPSDFIKWNAVRAKEQWKPKKVEQWFQRNEDEVRRAGLEKRLLTPLVECLPVLSGKRTIKEGQYILLVLEEAYKQVIYGLGDIKENSLAIKSLEDEFDRLTLRKTALSILYIDDKDTVNRLWQPLLQFGYIAKDWVRTFCSDFFLNLDNASVYPPMVMLLEEMLVYTLQCPTWSTKHVNKYNDFRISLMGFHAWRKDVWKYDYSVFTHQAEAIYKAWFYYYKLNHHVVDALLGFMITPSGKFMLDDGIKLLFLFFTKIFEMSQMPVPDGKIWDHHQEMDDKLGITLINIWQNGREELKKNQEIFTRYRDLVQYLVVTNNIIGIELQNSLMGDQV